MLNVNIGLTNAAQKSIKLLYGFMIFSIRKRTIASTCSYDLFSAIIVSHDTESKKLST